MILVYDGASGLVENTVETEWTGEVVRGRKIHNRSPQQQVASFRQQSARVKKE